MPRTSAQCLVWQHKGVDRKECDCMQCGSPEQNRMEVHSRQPSDWRRHLIGSTHLKQHEKEYAYFRSVVRLGLSKIRISQMSYARHVTCNRLHIDNSYYLGEMIMLLKTILTLDFLKKSLLCEEFPLHTLPALRFALSTKTILHHNGRLPHPHFKSLFHPCILKLKR